MTPNLMDLVYFLIEKLKEGWSYGLDLNYSGVIYVLNFLLSIITRLTDQIEQAEHFLKPYLKLITNFIYIIPDMLMQAVEYLYNYKFHLNNALERIARMDTKSRNEIKNRFYISILTSMTGLFFLVILLYKRRIYLLRLRNSELEKNPALNLCCICKAENSKIVLMPCRHLCLCLRCFYMMKKNAQGQFEETCPLCRTAIEHEIKIY